MLLKGIPVVRDLEPLLIDIEFFPEGLIAILLVVLPKDVPYIPLASVFVVRSDSFGSEVMSLSFTNFAPSGISCPSS